MSLPEHLPVADLAERDAPLGVVGLGRHVVVAAVDVQDLVLGGRRGHRAPDELEPSVRAWHTVSRATELERVRGSLLPRPAGGAPSASSRTALPDLVRARQEDVCRCVTQRRPPRRRPPGALVRRPAGMQEALDGRRARALLPPARTSVIAGWIGVHLNRGLDWNEIAGAIEDAYAEVAPKSLPWRSRRSPPVRRPQARGHVGRGQLGQPPAPAADRARLVHPPLGAEAERVLDLDHRDHRRARRTRAGSAPSAARGRRCRARASAASTQRALLRRRATSYQPRIVSLSWVPV